MRSVPTFDVVVVGGGIVGVATARSLALRGGFRVLILEAESDLARHQTGRNSGVVHSGLYYTPGSDKARFCTAGRQLLHRFCESHDIPYRRCGKLVVATEESQMPALEELARRGRANGLEGIERLERAAVSDREPSARGLAGLWIPQTGVVDFAAVTQALARDMRARGGEIWFDSRVRQIRRDGMRLQVETRRDAIECRVLVNCAGLQSDRVARLAGFEPQIRLIPFRGEYYELDDSRAHLVRSLIYPVPDPRFPFLGVHLTRTIDDRVLAGPNAMPAGSRQGYHRWDLSLRDLADTLSFPGFWRLAGSFWRTGLAEARRSFSKRAFTREARRLVPTLSMDHLRATRSGVRAQAVNRSGRLLDDFAILQEERQIHVLNAPSPAATACLAIGDHVASLATRDL